MFKKNLKENIAHHSEVDSESQSGRSMVEMLGVLAVMGVLSVAGIAGYTSAMRSYRTNEIVNAASTLYIMAMAQNAGNGPTANVSYTNVGGTNPSGVSTLEYNKDAKSIAITFTDSNDCTMALNKLGDKVSGTCPTLTVNFSGVRTSTTPETPTSETPTTITCPDNTTTCPSDEICCPTLVSHNRFLTNYTCQTEANCTTHSLSACEAACGDTCIPSCPCDEDKKALELGYRCGIMPVARCPMCN